MNRSIVILLLLLTGILSAPAALRRGYGIPGDPFYNRAQLDYAAEWRDFKSNTESISKTVGEKIPEAAQMLTQIQTNSLFLKTKWDAWFTKHPLPGTYASGDGYLQSLQRNNRQLSKVRKEKDDQKVLNVLRDVALDLQIKADNCRNSGDGLGKEIKVKVHTKADGKEIPGYEVFYVQKGMFDVKSAHDRFPRQSSPTDEKILCPGGYAMWVRKQNFISEPVTLRIGGRGETRLEVDLAVPPE